tara:strand:- start:62 stop:289 length:228 start_codon:yes stop_codon:yes gene_type:complete
MLLLPIIDLYSLVVFVAVVLSWLQLPASNPIARIVDTLTEPALKPIRRALPPVSGIDFSPFVLLLGLQILKGLLV